MYVFSSHSYNIITIDFKNKTSLLNNTHTKSMKVTINQIFKYLHDYFTEILISYSQKIATPICTLQQ